eukprot:6468988-Amphidinium_carterae.1
MRQEAVYIKLPKGGRPPKYPEARLAELIRELYGLQSGPMAWRCTLLASLAKAGWTQHPLCPCVFCLYGVVCVHDNGRFSARSERKAGGKQIKEGLCGVLLVQTDDVLSAGITEKYTRAMETLKTEFKFGKWEELYNGPGREFSTEVRLDIRC